MYIIDTEMSKPLQCTKCESQEIAKMLNTGVLKCLNCGKEKPSTKAWVQPLSSDSVFTRRVNKNSYRDF